MFAHTNRILAHAEACIRQAVTRSRAPLVAFPAVLGLSFSLAAAEPGKTIFNIEAQPAQQSLTEYALQANVQVGYTAAVVEDVLTNPVQGEYDNVRALEILLKDTGLEAEYGERGIFIRRIVAAEVSGDIEEPAPAVAGTTSLQLMQSAMPAFSQGSTTSAAEEDREENADGPRKIEEIVVTGTQIRGTTPVGVSVITLDREYIEVSGAATTQELIQTIPQNFGGGPNEDTTSAGLGAGEGNFGFGSSINLRGLGTESTLLLINGRRSAAGGGEGSFVDLNSIPIAAIERIEVLADGASAVYGSDAIGGVINVILREDYEGAETRLIYTPDINDIDGIQFSQVLGRSWDTGNILLTYEYYDRSSLKAADREATRDSDLTRLGGTNHDSTASNPGNINLYTLADGTTVPVTFGIPVGQDGTALTPADLLAGHLNLQNIREGSTVLPEQTRNSISMAVSQELTGKVDLFAEGRYSSRHFENFAQVNTFTQLTVPATNPFFVDPFGNATSLRLTYSLIDDYGAPRNSGKVSTLGGTLGATIGLDDDWEIEVYGSFNSEETTNKSDRFPNTALLSAALADPDPSTAFNPFGDGSNTNAATLSAIEGFRERNFDSELMVFNVLADGELFDLGGGAVKLAIGGEFRNESLQKHRMDFSSTLVPTPAANNFDHDRDVMAAFAELYIPIVTERNSLTGIRQLAISIAGRYDDYSDFGDTFNPKLGVRWSPFDSLNFRSAISTSFRAPLLTELDDQNRLLFTSPSPDPASPTGFSNTIFILGNSPDLTPQEGNTWTAGFDVTPASVPELSASVTYFKTQVNDVIQLPGNNIFEPLQNEAVFGSIIRRVPADADITTVTALLNEPRCFCSFSPDEVNAIVDFRTQNLAKVELSGVDLNMDYVVETGVGSFSASLYASHLFEFKEQLLNGPLVDKVDTLTKPNSLKLRGSFAWNYGGYHVAVVGKHIGDYKDHLSVPERKVSSWTTWDLQIGYAFGERESGLLDGSRVSLNVSNVFDRDPPFVDGSNGVGFDAINADVLGRIAVLELTKTW